MLNAHLCLFCYNESEFKESFHLFLKTNKIMKNQENYCLCKWIPLVINIMVPLKVSFLRCYSVLERHHFFFHFECLTLFV